MSSNRKLGSQIGSEVIEPEVMPLIQTGSDALNSNRKWCPQTGSDGIKPEVK